LVSSGFQSLSPGWQAGGAGIAPTRALALFIFFDARHVTSNGTVARCRKISSFDSPEILAIISPQS
jgi:hypothetical protein